MVPFFFRLYFYFIRLGEFRNSSPTQAKKWLEMGHPPALAVARDRVRKPARFGKQVREVRIVQPNGLST